MKFRVLHGQHIGHLDTGKKSKEGNPIFEDKTYPTGSVVDSDIDLLQFNGVGMTPKFQRLDFGGYGSHPLGEVWDANTETLEQFVERMQTKQQQTQQHETKQWQETTAARERPKSVSSASVSAAEGMEGGVSKVPQPAPGRADLPTPANQPTNPPEGRIPDSHVSPGAQPKLAPGSTELPDNEKQRGQDSPKSSSPAPLPPGVPPGTKPPKNEQEYAQMLQTMTVKDLQQYAAGQQIDLKGASNKDAIIKAIRLAHKDS